MLVSLIQSSSIDFVITIMTAKMVLMKTAQVDFQISNFHHGDFHEHWHHILCETRYLNGRTILKSAKVIQCAEFGEPTANGCCNTYIIHGDEYVANGQTATGHDIFFNTNVNSLSNHLAFYSFGTMKNTWFRSSWTPKEIEDAGTIEFADFVSVDSLCPPTDVEWKYRSAPKCKMGGPILTDHCAVNNCHTDADCTNTLNSFQCACKPGFEGDGLECTALPVENECENGKNTCDATGATCTDTKYSYECECDAGYWDADSANPGRSCEGCCKTIELRYSERFEGWPDEAHGMLRTTCSLDTSTVYNDHYIYDCDTADHLSIYYFVNFLDSTLNEVGFEVMLPMIRTGRGSS